MDDAARPKSLGREPAYGLTAGTLLRGDVTREGEDGGSEEEEAEAAASIALGPSEAAGGGGEDAAERGERVSGLGAPL